MQHIKSVSTQMSIDESLLVEAKELGIDISHAAEDGLKSAIAAARLHDWRAANREAIDDYNAFVEQNGVPFADLRKF